MARTRTLSDLIADVRHVGDIEGAVQRHPDEAIIRHLNQSIQAFRLMISSVCSYYLDDATGTIAAGASTVTLPSDFVRAYGLDVSVGGRWRELFPFQFSERNAFQDTWAQTGAPMYFREQNATTLTVLPTPDATYSYKLWYLPTGDDLVNDSDTFDGVAGWEDWIVYDAALKTATRDAGVNDNFELLQAELGRIEARIKAEAAKRHIPGATHRVDTRGRRAQVAWNNRWRAG